MLINLNPNDRANLMLGLILNFNLASDSLLNLSSVSSLIPTPPTMLSPSLAASQPSDRKGLGRDGVDISRIIMQLVDSVGGCWGGVGCGRTAKKSLVVL